MEEYLHGLKEETHDAVIKEMLDYVDNGLPEATAPKDVIVIGAGMAGLVAGQLLRQAGHRVRIIEASNRVGGRILTLREPFSGDHYAEAGAMRLPEHHHLLQAYIKKLNLPRQPFYNVDIDPETLNELAPAKRNHEYIYVNGVKVRRKDYLNGKGEMLGYPRAPQERGKTAQELLDAAIGPLREFINANPEKNWPVVIERFGEYSIRRFFKEQTLYSEAAIEMIAVLFNLESRMMTSFLQSFIEFSNISAEIQYWQIPGGIDHLPKAFLPHLEDCITFGARMIKLDWEPKQNRVTVHIANREPVTGEVAIVTIPFSSLRFVQICPSFSHFKRKAIRELHYDAATKVLLEFNRRFWELDDDIYGGSTVTDLPIRFIYYPSHHIGSDKGGVVLASYTWGDDAMRWDSLTPEERYQFALDNLAIIHGEQIREAYLGGATHSWMEDDYSFGQAAIFAPGQLETLHPYITSREGNVHFAGEHTSLKHAWIEGAIESGIRTALEVNDNI